MKNINAYLVFFTVHQTNHEYKVDFVVGVLGVPFLTQGLKPLVSQCTFNIFFFARRLIFSRDKFLFMAFFFPLTPMIGPFFDNLWALGQRLVRKGEFDKYLTRPINLLSYILLRPFN